jgi:hypothetical protein
VPESVTIRPSRSRVRLTRRGRAVLFGSVVLLAALLILLLVMAFAGPASGAAGSGDPSRPTGAVASGDPPVAVVLPGDTLWSVAARHVPSSDAYGMIEEIRRLNGLSGHTVHPGQQLVLPRR